MKKKLFFILLIGVLSLAFFNFVLKKQALKLYCLRKIHVQIADFRSSAFRLGVVHIDEEEKYIESVKNDLYAQCLKSS